LLSQIYFLSLIRVTEERYDGSTSISAFYCGVLGSPLGSETDTTPKSLKEYDWTVTQVMP